MRWTALAILLAAAGWTVAARRGPVAVTVTEEVVVPEVRRFGVNLGTWTSWGAEQLPSNVLKNPGFEGVLDRAIAVAAFSANGEFSDDTAWLARADDFWTGAAYEVLTGESAGTRGRIANSRARGAGGLPVFFLEGPAARVEHGDVIALTRVDDLGLPTQWWIRASEPGSVVTGEPRPGSPGVRSLNLRSAGDAVSSYLDAIGDRAGKLLPVEGGWLLSFWARGSTAGTGLSVSFRRHGSEAFLSDRIPLTRTWRHYEIPFHAVDSGPAGTLELCFTNSGDGGPTLLDDVELGPVQAESGFRREVVETLRQLRPAYLRDWQGQLGDTLENRVAPPFSRRATRYRPGGAEATDYAYGLAETLALCRRVDANPWLVVPAAFGIAECSGLGRYLGSSGAGFAEVLVEFGNENWNPLFRPAGIPDPVAHGAAAQRCLEAIRREAGPAVVRTVVNAQAANPGAAERVASMAPQADLVAIAPYFLYSLATGLSPAQRRGALFQIPAAPPNPGKSGLAVYEVNLHTVEGDATAGERNDVTGSAAAGAALAWTMLEALRAGAVRQCAYTLAGFDTRLAAREGYVELWGLTRDLAGSGHWRPTGRALAMLNGVLGGSLHRSTGERAGIAVYGFRNRDAWSAVVLNRSPEGRSVEIRFAAGIPPDAVRVLGEEGIWEGTLRRDRTSVALELPGESLAVLAQRGGA